MIDGYDTDAVRRAEEPALAAGEPLMRNASFAIAVRIIALLRDHQVPVPGARVLVLAGGGNNGGDGLYAAADLARRGLQVTCVLAHREPHPGGLGAARTAGARIVDFAAQVDPDLLTELAGGANIWIDALAGIGVRGALRGVPADLIAALAPLRSSAPVDPLVVAVDVPSGIGADLDPGSPAPALDPAAVLRADLTLTMGAAKAALLVPPGSLAAGQVEVVDLGLGAEFARQRPSVQRLTDRDVADLWPVPERADHKYTRGVVGIAAGSARYPGAGVLCTGGALGVGIGMVRYLGTAGEQVTAAHPEVVTEPGRVQSLVIGPGIADDAELDSAMDHARRAWDAEGERVAVVLDAGALTQVPVHPGALAGKPVVLTPHAGELAALLARAGTDVDRADIEADPWRWAHTAAAHTGACVLLKGPVTVIAGGNGPGYSQAGGTPWLATAGAGDVLAGILGAMLAQATTDVATVAAAAVVVHARAARLHPGPLSASALVRQVPRAIADLLGEHP